MLKILISSLLTVTLCWAGVNNIVRPCDLSNYKCIRDNLAAKSRCSPDVIGTIPNQYVIKDFPFETPYFNATYVDKILIVYNHDQCYISQYMINKDTDNIVISLDCKNFTLESDRVRIQHRSLREDTNHTFHFKATYPLIRMTANLPVYIQHDFCKAHIFTEVLQLPVLHMHPKDKPKKKDFPRDLSLLTIFERENFYYRGYPIMRIFIDAIICNFGCPRHIL